MFCYEINVTTAFASFCCIVLTFVTVDCQSTNKLTSFYDDWINEVSSATDGSVCPECFQKMADTLAEQLLSLKEEASRDLEDFDELHSLRMAYSGLRDILNSELLILNDIVYDTNNTIFVIGDTGATGATGSTGRTGPIGPTGATGSTGASGLSGLPGQMGPTGMPGPDGFIGRQGATGPTGKSGVTGNTGSTGTRGVQGPPGSTGAVGATGPPGNTGPVG